MNRKINYCPSCGEKDQKEGARFCWFCGEELPKIETPSTPSQLLESEINPTRDNIPIGESLKKDFVSDLESKDHDYKETPKTEIPPVSRDLQELENNSASKDRDVKRDGVVNTNSTSQKQPVSNASNYFALFVTIIILGICVFVIFESYLTGTYGPMVSYIAVLIIILMVLALIIMEIKQNRPEKPAQLSGKDKYENYKNILYSILFFYVIVLLIALWSFASNMEMLQGVTILGLLFLTYIIVLILMAMKKNKIALGITIILALYWFLAVMSNFLYSFPGYFTADFIGHTATNFIGLIITGIIMGFILRSMKKHKLK